MKDLPTAKEQCATCSPHLDPAPSPAGPSILRGLSSQHSHKLRKPWDKCTPEEEFLTPTPAAEGTTMPAHTSQVERGGHGQAWGQGCQGLGVRNRLLLATPKDRWLVEEL